jgi:hypothetical protein
VWPEGLGKFKNHLIGNSHKLIFSGRMSTGRVFVFWHVETLSASFGHILLITFLILHTHFGVLMYENPNSPCFVPGE